MAGVRVRSAQAGDVAVVLRLWSAARSPEATTSDDAPAVERLLRHDSGALLLAELDGQIVGTAIAAWDGWRGHIYRLAVLPEHRLKGVGRRLVAAGHQRLRALGATRVNATVGEHDPGPIAFWLAVGYHRDAGMSRFAKTL
jgi:GNAT superfamily N-acetyltransferase